MKKKMAKLVLHTETLRRLSGPSLGTVGGGMYVISDWTDCTNCETNFGCRAETNDYGPTLCNPCEM